MGAIRHKDLHVAAEAKGPAKRRLSRLPRFTVPVLSCAVIVACGVFVVWINHNGGAGSGGTVPVAATRPIGAAYIQKAKSLAELVKMTPDQLEDVDIAEMHLVCAKGLPGAERLDVARSLAGLDELAGRVSQETRLYGLGAAYPRWAGQDKHAEDLLRAQSLVQALQEGREGELARAGRPATGSAPAPPESAGGGDNVSATVRCVAVGRRLGYPLKLVRAKGHVFARWDDGQERFNMETAGERFESFPDDHYKSWPHECTEGEIKANRYLVSLSAPEELAFFLGWRGDCLLGAGRFKEALEAYAAARRLDGRNYTYLAALEQAEALAFGGRSGIPESPMSYRGGDLLEEVERINALNRAARQGMRPPMPGGPQLPRPGVDPPVPYQPPRPGQPPRP